MSRRRISTSKPLSSEGSRKRKVVRGMEKQIKIEIDTKDLDDALEKANKLLELLKDVQQIVYSLSNSNS